jgi:hypothetical protein
MNSAFIDCEQIANLGRISGCLALNDEINGLLQAIYNRTQQYYGPEEGRTPIECHIFASIYNCILTQNNAFNVEKINYTIDPETNLPNNEMPNLEPNQVATLYLIPPLVSSIEYHYITVCPVDENYVIYSANGNFFVPVFTVPKDDFNTWYRTVLTKNNGNLNYPENGDINSTGIGEAWNGITDIDLATVFQTNVERLNTNNDEDDEDGEDDEMSPDEIWDELMDKFKQVNYPSIITWVYTRQQGGKRKVYKKRKTQKRRKSNKKRKMTKRRR